MRPSIPGRSLLAAWIVAGLPLHAQSYQSSFSGVQFDRARTPGSFTGGVSVDAPSGAASVDLPLGPGIGRGALRFQPRLSARFSARVQATVLRPALYDMPPFAWGDQDASGSTAEVMALNTGTSEATTLQAGGASLSPGYLDLLFSNGGGGRFTSNYQLPDGGSGSVAGTVPAGVNVGTILADFGYSGSTQVSRAPGRADLANPPSLLAMGSGDELVIGLVDPAFPLATPADLHSPTSPVPWQVPSRVLVVRGDLAFEFIYVNPVYAVTSVALPRTHNDPNGRNFEDLRYGHYLINRVLNRFGESLDFDHFQGTPSRCNGFDYRVRWKSGSTIHATLEIKLDTATPISPSPVAVLLDNHFSQFPNTRYTVTASYPGLAQSAYRVEAYAAEGNPTSLVRQPDLFPVRDAWSTYQNGPWDGVRMNLQPVKVVELDTNATVTFRYGAGPGSGPRVTYVDPQTGANAAFDPTVLVGVDFPGRSVDLTWEVYPYRENLYKSDYDGFTPVGPLGRPHSFLGVSRIQDQDTTTGTVRETRHTRVVPVPQWSGWGWDSTTFHDAVRHPDGSTTLHLFIQPLANAPGSSVGGPSDTPENQIRTLGFLKHSVRETRHYRIGAAWASDVGVPAASSSAHTVETFDRWDLRRVGNPGGTVLAGSVPYPTRTQTSSRDMGTLSRQERVTWDSGKLGWTLDVARAYASPSLAGFGWRSLAATASPSDAPAAPIIRDVTRTLSPDFVRWFPGRVTVERVNGKPPVSTVFNSNNTVARATVGENGSTVTTAFTYSGALPQTVTLSGTDGGGTLDGSGSVGIAQYGYDARGFLTSIRARGVTYSSSQENDALGRPTSQTDPNALRTEFDWDGVGRPTALRPRTGEVETSIVYDPDQRGSTVTRGAERSAHRYNGFGELVLTSRHNGSAWSHKRFEYDAAGRKLRETVWLAGKGSETESTSGADATVWGYDDRGRLKSVVDPNGMTASTTYAGLGQTNTVAPNTADAKATAFTRDEAGRLVEVQDALGQVTKYGYYESDQIKEVEHVGSGQPKRRWTYNGLGWLTTLVQPESGTTAYSDFHVTGKPGKATYAGAPVTTTYDSQGRPKAVAGSGISQAFAYDEAGHGAALGKLTSSSDQGASLSFTYSGATGRLSRLDTDIMKSGGVPGTVPYAQSFLYDAHGRRTTAITDGRRQDTAYAEATGQPTSVAYSGAGMLDRTLASVTQFDAACWMPKAISYAATGTSTLLAYRPDQASLAMMAHYAGAPSPLRQWTYAYDFAGRLKTDGEDTYTYDKLDRLQSATVQRKDSATVTQTFAYDAVGNPVSSLASPVPADLTGLINNFAFNAAEQATMLATNRIPTTAGGVPTGARYDSRGNLTQIYAQATSGTAKVISLSYDLLGRATELTRPDGKVERYFYTPEGLRTLIEVWEAGVLKTVKHRLYNDARQLVAEYEGKFAP